MKKVAFISLILILLAVAVIPVMAAGNPHGNGNSEGQGNGGGNQGQLKLQGRNGNANNGAKGNGTQQHTRMSTPFYLQGTISAIDTISDTVTITLTHGNAQVKQFIGNELTITVTDTTMIFKLTQGDDTEGTTMQSTAPTMSNAVSGETDNNDEGPSNRVPITFGELAVGQYVAIHGNLVNSVFTARLITVYINMSIGQPVSAKP